MMNISRITCVSAAILILAVLTSAQDNPELESKLSQAAANSSSQSLKTADVTAILSTDKAPVGLHLSDVEQGLANAVASINRNFPGQKDYNADKKNHSGFSIVAFTPKAWIGLKKAEHTRKHIPFSESDVSESDRLPVFRVVVSPDTPDYVTSTGAGVSKSVDHVVIRTTDKAQTIQPLLISPYEITVSNAMGGKLSKNGAIAVFSMDELSTIRTASKNGEFLITIVADKGPDRDFKVKKKHFEDIP